MNEIVRQLEISLGPDTGDLCMRIGIHSGPVTAGVLRGDKARFQLFGDTMNTVSCLSLVLAWGGLHPFLVFLAFISRAFISAHLTMF